MGKHPNLLIESGDVHPRALVPGDPDRVDRIASRCEDTRLVSENREYTIVNGTYQGEPITIASTGVGSPSAAIAIEELARSGVDTFLRVGTAGALQSDVSIGDIVVPTGAAKVEGTTKRYEDVSYPAVPDADVLRTVIDATGRAEPDDHVGAIVTDDAFYAETDEYVADWEAAGLLAIEMEASTLFTLARRRGFRAGAVLTIDGNLVAGTQKGETEDENELPERADETVGQAIDLALEALVDLEPANQ